jgi:type II secretory pathway pseudopilin PulG
LGAFTLVEILIAIGILGLVCASIFSTWTAILRASRVGLDAAATVQRARMVSHVFEESLSAAQFFTANQRYYALEAENGEAGRLSFVAHLSKSFPRSGKFGDLDVRRLTFEVEGSAESGRVLVLRQQPLIMDMDEDEKVHPIVLAKNVKELATEFWDMREGWVDEWTQTNQLPTLVKVSLKLMDRPGQMGPPEEITRIVSLPTMAVPPVWQVPRGFGGPNQPPPPPGTQNQPGTLPGFQMPGGAPGGGAKPQ